MKKKWFKLKEYGYGWKPASWEGWLTVSIYLILIIGLGLAVNPQEQKELGILFILPVIILTTTLITIAYKTGGKPEWRWGTTKDKNSPTKNS
ncbi:MAG TPA: hypothetical protein VGE63_02515 [Candidatus Paceibacterota bacterium]